MTKSRSNAGKSQGDQNGKFIVETSFIPLADHEQETELEPYAKLELLRSLNREWLQKVKADGKLFRAQASLIMERRVNAQPYEDLKLAVKKTDSRLQANMVILKRLQLLATDHIVFMQEQRNLRTQIARIMQQSVSKDEKKDTQIKHQRLERAPLFFQTPVSEKSKIKLLIIPENKKLRLK